MFFTQILFPPSWKSTRSFTTQPLIWQWLSTPEIRGPSLSPRCLPLQCIDDVKAWVTVNKLKLNDDKTEAMIVFSVRESRSLSSSFSDSMTIGSASVPLSDSVKKTLCYCHLSWFRLKDESTWLKHSGQYKPSTTTHRVLLVENATSQIKSLPRSGAFRLLENLQKRRIFCPQNCSLIHVRIAKAARMMLFLCLCSAIL